jgi:type IV pilus assembly protein PilE
MITGSELMRKKQTGMTLVELLIVVGIVAILAAIAYPSYRNQVMRSNRSEARNTLINTAQALERCFTHVRTYVGCASVRRGPSETRKYDIDWEDGDITATEFLITATPLDGSVQVNDDDCAIFEITEARRRAFNSDGDENPACWR